jgi:hypothetical protein
MTFLHLDTVIAFGAVMLAASLAVTVGTQLAISLLGLRGANLRRSLADLFESASQDRDAKRYSKVIARRVLHQPLVSGSVFSRFGIRMDGLPFMPADAAGKLRWAGSGIPLQPWILGAVGGFFGWPAALWIIKRLFSMDFCSYSTVVTQYVPFLNLCEHPWRSGAILGAIFGGLLSRWRLATFIRLDEMVSILEKLSAPAGGTLPDPAQRAMLVIAGETQSRTTPAKKNPVSAQMDRIFRHTDDDEGGGVAVAVERPITQVAAPAEARLEGLNLWFDRAMERASQRFTVQARVITVVLSLVLVLGAHMDAIRLFRMLSSDAQQRAQMVAGADALIKQAEQIPRAREGARSVVPDVYRSAMAAVLEVAPVATEQPKAKPHRASRNGAAAGDTATAPSGGTADPSDVQTSASVSPEAGEGGQATPAAGKAPTGSSTKGRGSKSGTATKQKSTAKDREKSAAAPGEDRAIVEAKARAGKALESRPGFASREDAVLWLRATLDGDPALENLAAAYEQEVNADLAGDADKLIDHSASIKRELARSEFRVLPETWPGWTPTSQELPGLLVALAFLCLGAPICYNLLKSIASLRPLPAIPVNSKDKK